MWAALKTLALRAWFATPSNWWRRESDRHKSERPAATGRNATNQNKRAVSLSTAEKTGNPEKIGGAS